MGVDARGPASSSGAARRIVSRCLAPLSIKVLYEYLTIMLADRRTSVEAGSELNVGAVIATPSAVTLSGVAARTWACWDGMFSWCEDIYGSIK
jgi:hypothetical protein